MEKLVSNMVELIPDIFRLVRIQGLMDGNSGQMIVIVIFHGLTPILEGLIIQTRLPNL
jgi:hypothetical protein